MLRSLPADKSPMTERYERVLAPRAVLPSFVSNDWGERYVEFEQGDWEAFQALHSHPEGFHRRIVRQTGGYIVNRWDVTGDRLVPYLRPDKAVRLDPRKKPTKYIQPSRAYPGQAKRLDVHPLVRERLLTNTQEPIYLCLEGCLKADAVAGTDRLAISVPSVTLWKLEEEHLAPWLPILKRAPMVYVVPDSDYLPKLEGYGTAGEPVFVNEGQVRYFTDKCVIHYRQKYGLRMRYLVPPFLSWEEALFRGIDSESRWKVGIDDHIAWGKGWDQWSETNQSGLHIFERVRGPWRRLPGPRGRRGWGASADRRDREFLRHLERTRGGVGLFSIADICDELGWTDPKRVYRARKSCEARGVLEVWPGRPLGEGGGNKAHVFRFVVERGR